MQSGFFYKANASLGERWTGVFASDTPMPAAYFATGRGHQLAYDLYGKPSGYPLFYFHDAGSSRLEALFFHKAARHQGFKLIAIDRPGIGCSDFYTSASTVDFCHDVVQLADSLGYSEFGVMSFGAGGVYATSLAYWYPDRVSLHLNLAGVPGNVFNENPERSVTASLIFEMTPVLIKYRVRLQHALSTRNPELLLERLYEQLSYTDRKILALASVRKTLAMDQQETIRNGARGVAQDLAMCFRKLDFRLHEVPVPTLIWQGGADRLSSRADCEYLVARLPNARFFRVPHRGHFFFINCMNEVFQRLRVCAVNRQTLAA